MTELLFLNNSYLRECGSNVVSVSDDLVVLDKTVFYPTGGGQPCDSGSINGLSVVNVFKRDGVVYHQVVGSLSVGDKVHCVIDWNRRYKLMRMHTAAHVISAVLSNEAGAKSTGGELGLEQSRDDFSVENYSRELLESYIQKANDLLKSNADIKVYSMSREEVLARPEMVKLEKGLLPLDIFRIVEIVGVDAQPDGGTHVHNTREVGQIRLLRVENKGKGNRRIYFALG